jgi:hypothetical protein
VIEDEPHNAGEAALRWLGRWALESREATVDGLLEPTVALSALVNEPEHWEAVRRLLVRAVWAPPSLAAAGAAYQ